MREYDHPQEGGGTLGLGGEVPSKGTPNQLTFLSSTATCTGGRSLCGSGGERGTSMAGRSWAVALAKRDSKGEWTCGRMCGMVWKVWSKGCIACLPPHLHITLRPRSTPEVLTPPSTHPSGIASLPPRAPGGSCRTRCHSWKIVDKKGG